MLVRIFISDALGCGASTSAAVCLYTIGTMLLWRELKRRFIFAAQSHCAIAV